MFEALRGRVESLTPTRVVLEVGGCSYGLEISLTTSEELARRAQAPDLRLLVHHRLQDDRMRLFGFFEEAERQLFRQLVAVAGIGPSHGLALLSSAPPQQVWQAIREGRWQLLARTKGIGPKIAQRACNELSDRAQRMPLLPPEQATGAGPTTEESRDFELVEDAVSALLVLGYTDAQARTAVQKARPEASDLQDLIRRALRQS